MVRKRLRNLRIISSLALVFFLLGAGPSAEELDKTAQEISESTMSPFCPGRTISSCPSPQARELRGQIHTWLGQGYTPEGVRNQLLLIYGEDVRGVPQSEGFGLVGWWMPLVFVLLSVSLVIVKLRKMKKNSPAPQPATRVSPETEQQVEAALRRRMT